MEPSATLPTAIAATALGLALLGLVWLALRLAARSQAWSTVRVASPVTMPLERGAAEAAVLWVEAGGRLRFVNDRARKLFELRGLTPTVWQLARKAQPAEAFETLFVAEGRTSLNIGEQHVEATSLRVSAGNSPEFVIVLREADAGSQIDLDLTDPAARSAQALNVLTEINHAISANLDLAATLDAIINNLGRVFQYNTAEITLWDEATQELLPVRRTGSRDYERALAKAGRTAHSLGESYSGWLTAHRTPLRVDDLQTFTTVRPLFESADFPAHAYLGAPLLNGQELVGTVELLSFKVNAYRKSDELLIATIAGQAAIAIQNAHRYAEQQQHLAELKALSDIARAIESTADPRELYARLTTDIARLMESQIAGLLLWDQAQNMLVGQPPFHGMPDIVSVLYQIMIPSGSLVAQRWQANSAWLCNQAADDPDIDATGLRQMVDAVGIRTSLLAPISAGGRKVGAVHICNKADGKAPFTEADARRLMMFAGQAAAILDNARLVEEAKSRAEQAEGLRSIATGLASSTNLDEVLHTAMQQSAALLHFDVGVISLLDEARGELAPHPASIYGTSSEKTQLVRLRASDPDYPLSVTRQRRTLFIGSVYRDSLDDAAQPVAGIYRKAVDQFKLESVMAVPLVAGDHCLGEMLVGARREDTFTRAELPLLVTLAAQLASGIERVRLYAATDQNLQRRVDQLTTLSRVSREISQTLVLENLLRLVGDEAKRITRADCGTLVLLAGDGRREAELRVGDEELGSRLTALEMELVAAADPSGELVKVEARRLSDLPAASPLAAHPGVRSALIVPIVAGGVLAGFMHLHSRQLEGFDEAAEEITGALAAQTAIAVTNAQRLGEHEKRNQLLSRRAEQLAQLLQISRTVRSDLPLTTNLEIIAAGVWEAVGFNVVLISVLDPQTKLLKRTAAAGLPLETFARLQQIDIPWAGLANLLQEEFRLGHGYFVPQERAQQVGYVELVPDSGRVASSVFVNAWQPGDLFLVPLVGLKEEIVGLLALDSPLEGVRPDRITAEIVEIFASQATLAIENAWLYQAADRRAARLLALHRVNERANRAERSQIWQTMAEALVDELALDVSLVAMVDLSAASSPRQRRFAVQGKAGRVSAEIDFAPMFAAVVSAMEEADEPEGRPIGIEPSPQSILVLDVANTTAWASHPLILATQVTSFAATPIVSQGQLAGVLFAGARGVASPLMPEDLNLFITLANQLGASLESARLEAEALAERGERAAQLTALAEVTRIITAALRPGDVIRTIMENVYRLIPYDSVTLWLRTERHQTSSLRVAATLGLEDEAERLGLTVDVADSVLFAEMALTGGAICVPDVREDPRFPGAIFLPIRSWLGVPLISRGQIFGALVVDKVEVKAYSPQSAQVLMAFANQAAVALENARLFEESEQRNAEFNERSERLSLLNRISTQLSSTLDEARLYEVTLSEVAQALNVAQAAMVAFEPGGKTRVAAQIPAGRPLPESFDRSPAILRVLETLTPVAVEDVSQDLLLTEAQAIFAAREVKSLLVIPMVVAGTPLAAMQFEETAARRFTPEEIELAQTLANQAAVAVQNARLYNEAQARLNELATLNQLSRALASTINLEQVYQTVRDQVRAVMGVDSIYLALYDEASNQMSFPFMVERGELIEVVPCAPGGLTGHIIHTRQPLHLHGSWPDVQAQLQSLQALQTGANAAAHSYLGVPLIIGERVAGVLAVQDLARSDVFTSNHERLLTIIGAQVAVTVENARFAQELETRVAARTTDLERARVRMETLLRITTELTASLDLDRVLARTLELVTGAVKAPQGSIYLIDDENPLQLIYRAALGRPVPLRAGGELSPFKANEGLIGWVIQNRQGLISGDVDADPRWTPLPNRVTRARSALAVPLMAGEEVLGGMILLSGQPDAFDEEQLRLVAPAANLVGTAINNAKLYRMIENLNRETGQALRDQMVEASKSRAILEGIADGVMVTDERSAVILFNAACERILGLARDQVVGQPALNFVGIYGASGRAWLEAMAGWIQDPGSIDTGKFFSEQVTLDRKRIISVHVSPVTTGREYLGSVSVIRDITHEVEVDRLKSEFVTNVSHELRTPMAAIKGYADILLMGAGGPVAPQQAKFLQVIKGNADRLGILVNDLLDISRLESGRVDMVLQPLDIQDVIHSVTHALERRTVQQSKRMTVIADVPEGLPPVLGDRERVAQIIQALADNAFNYSEAGETIRLAVRLDENQLQIDVSDTGIGMAPEEQKRLFDRFYRGENPLVLKTPGNGLGLAIARQLAQMQGGRVWLVRSQPGQGTTFAVTLPVAG